MLAQTFLFFNFHRCSVTKSCLTLHDSLDYSTPGFPVLHHLPELLKLMSIELVMPSNHLILCRPFSSALNLSQQQGFFPVSRLFVSSGQGFGASASVSVLPMNIQGWFPSGSSDLMSLLSKGLSRVFSSTTVWKHQFFGIQPSLWSNSHIHTWLLENHSFVCTLCQQSDISAFL